MTDGPLSTSAIIVIVIVVCLAIVSVGAALTRHYYRPGENFSAYQPTPEQDVYMRSVRQRNLGHFRRESAMMGMRDVESQCMFYLVFYGLLWPC